MPELINGNIRFLQQGIELLNTLNDELYCKVVESYFASSVGKHVRHNLDHYESFLAGLADGKINYDMRQRDIRVETDRHYAVQKMRSLIPRLDALSGQSSDRPLLSKMNEVDGTDAGSGWCSSTIGRELQFLMSHTVHHYALVAIILKIQGFDCGKDFGVAPSTLKYEGSRNQCAPSLG